MSGFDLSLLLYLAAWYAGNYYYNIYNKLAANEAGGATYAMSLATIQQLVGCVYAVALWVAPEARPCPKVTASQFVELAPLGFFSAAAFASSVFTMSAGAVSFGQIVKAAEPACAAAVGYLAYKQSISKAKMICLVPIIGGICIASAEELDFTLGVLIAGSIANITAAFRGGENKRVMADPDLLQSLGGAGNTFAVTTIWTTVMMIPLIFLSGEYERRAAFLALWNSSVSLRYNTYMAGLTFYLYSEFSTLALKTISGVTHSVANTAKRAIIIVGCALVLGESFAPKKMAGCAIAIVGVFLYSIVDDLVKKKKAA